MWALVLGYLLGSIPFGLLLTRAAGLGDVRQIGSHSIGATNVLRTGNKPIAALTLLLDVLKGTAAVLLAMWLSLRFQLTGTEIGKLLPAGADQARVFVINWNPAVAGFVGGLGAFLGHVFPVWLGFKGGKGVATYIGVLIGAVWPAALVFAAAWAITAWLTRYSSLSSLVATFLTFLYLAATGGPFVAPLAAVISALLYWKHRENIRRLTAGTESRIGAKG